jgi:CheY-like chemotaxis protein
MSHDIRTPLSGILGISHLLEDKIKNPEQKQYAKWIRESSEQLLSLLDGVLEVVSSNSLSETDLNLTSCDIRELIKEITLLEQPTAELKKLSLQVTINNSVPEFIMTDRTKLHRVLLNLIGNAIKFTEKGAISIRVSPIIHDNGEAQLQFSIIDTGIGIPEDLQKKIFDRFYRIVPSEKGLSAGNGVGLHIAQSYVNLLGGEIKLTSEVNVGTKFYFNLRYQPGAGPIASNIQIYHENQAQSEQHRESNSNKNSVNSSTSRYKILLVEDNLIAMKIAEAILIQTGCCFESATDGELAYELATHDRYDLIITDIGLPGISGIEFARSLRKWEVSQNKRKTPIIGLTANDRELTLKKGLDSGMDNILSKPLTLEQMNQIKETYLSLNKK